MTARQFNGFVRFVLDDILEVLEKMPEGPEKEKLKKTADNLQKTLEDQVFSKGVKSVKGFTPFYCLKAAGSLYLLDIIIPYP